MSRRLHDGRHFDAWAPTYDRHPARFFFRWVHHEILRALEDRVLPGGVVLDVGCGTGELLRRLGPNLDGRPSVGVDASSAMVVVAARKLVPARVLVGLAHRLPIGSGQAALVVSTISFHHWDGQQASLAELARVLTPGGQVVMADFFAAGVLAPLVGRLGRAHGAGFRSVQGLESLLGEVGLRLTGNRRLGPPGSPLRLVAATTGPPENHP